MTAALCFVRAAGALSARTCAITAHRTIKSQGNCRNTFNMYDLRLNYFLDTYILYILLKPNPTAGSLTAVYIPEEFIMRKSAMC